MTIDYKFFKPKIKSLFKNRVQTLKRRYGQLVNVKNLFIKMNYSVI